MVATGSAADAGTTIINETDQSAVNILQGSLSSTVVWQTNVALTNNGSLYSVIANDAATDVQSLGVYYSIGGITASETSFGEYANGQYYVQSTGGWSATGPVIKGTAVSLTSVKSLAVSEGTSTIDGKSNTIYVGTDTGLSVIQEKQGGANVGDGFDESNGSVKYYTKDSITEEMVGDIQGMWSFNESSGSLLDASIKGNYLEDENAPTYSVSAVYQLIALALKIQL